MGSGPGSGRKANKNLVAKWIVEHSRVPSVKQVQEITGYGYDHSQLIRREVLGEMPEVNWDEIWELHKQRLIEKLEEDEVSVANLIQMMPFTLAKKQDIKTDSNVEFKITIQKPDEPDAE